MQNRDDALTLNSHRVRRRTLYVFPAYSTHYTAVFYNGVGDGTFVDGSYDAQASTDVMTDVSTPDFRAKQARGWIVMSPMSRITVTLSGQPMYWASAYYDRPYAQLRVAYSWETWWARGGSSFFPTVSLPAPPIDMSSAAVIGAYAAAYESAAQAFVDLLEGGQTLAMIHQAVVDAVKLARKSLVRRPNKAGRVAWPRYRTKSRLTATSSSPLRSLATASPDLWLEWRYGWTPLMKSVSDYANALEQSLRPLRVRGSSSKHHQTRNTGTKVTGATQIGVSCPDNVTATTTLTREMRAKAVVIAEVPVSLQRSLGMTVDTIPSTAWELVPFSFVVDWFVDIGDWIKAVSRPPGTRVLGTCLTTTYITREENSAVTQSYDFTVGSGSSAKRFTQFGGKDLWTRETKVVDRVPGVLPPALPPLKEGRSINIKHSLDGIALGITQLRNLLR